MRIHTDPDPTSDSTHEDNSLLTCENSKLPVGGLLAVSDEHVILPRLHVEVLHLQGDNLALGIPQNIKEITQKKKFAFLPDYETSQVTE
jgi:hypothetical protein